MKINFHMLANEGVRYLSPYQPGKPGNPLCVQLANNENLLGPSPFALAALQQSLATTHFYPAGDCAELKLKLASHLSVSPAELTIGNGSENILELIVKSFLHPNNAAVISQYTFLTIPLLIQSYGSQAIVIPTKNWQDDIDAMVNAIDEKTRLLFLVNPSNPTGTYTNKLALEKLLATIPANVIIVIDEAYAEYATEDDYPHTIAYLKQYPNLIITRTFSKLYGLAALRLGYAISSPEIADILNRARLPFNVNTLAAKAGSAALQDIEHMKASIAFNKAGRQQLEEGLRELKIAFIPSITNFITMDVGNADAIYRQLLNANIVVRPLTNYNLPNHIRVTISNYQQNEQFLSALKKISVSSSSPQ